MSFSTTHFTIIFRKYFFLYFYFYCCVSFPLFPFLLYILFLYIFCIVVDLWDGPEMPIVYHGNTLTTKIAFTDVVSVIAQFAFEASRSVYTALYIIYKKIDLFGYREEEEKNKNDTMLNVAKSHIACVHSGALWGHSRINLREDVTRAHSARTAALTAGVLYVTRITEGDELSHSKVLNKSFIIYNLTNEKLCVCFVL